MNCAAFRNRWRSYSLLLAALGVLLTVWSLPGISAEPAKPEANAEVYQAWPFDASEAKRQQEETANRLNIPVERTLDLGDGLKLELVLIPAGKFVMGTEEPESTWIGGTILGTAGLLALVLLAVLVVRAIRQKRWPQFSLRWLVLLVALLGVAQYGGFRSWRAAEAWKSFGANEHPAHMVTSGKPYYIGKFEVTQEQYVQVMGSNPSYFKGRELPVETVSWDDAQAFCRKASEKTGSVVRLPTEAEWERACRAGTKTRYYTGDAETDLDRGGWYKKNSKVAPHPVGQKTPNAWGVYDMHGNVGEWCEDDWHDSYQGGAVDGGAWADSPRGTCRVLRHGSWYSYGRNARSASRLGVSSDSRSGYPGFRVVVSL